MPNSKAMNLILCVIYVLNITRVIFINVNYSYLYIKYQNNQ